MTDAIPTDGWRLFDLAHENLKSIGKAQHFYLSTLFVYLCVVWGWHFASSESAVPVQVFGITLKTNGLWVITPGVTTALCLGLIGAVNAAGPAWRRLREHSAQLNLNLSRGVTFYELDTYKNLFDYLAYLRLNPKGSLIEQSGQKFYLWHFLYPSLYVASIYTSYRAAIEVWGLCGLTGHPLALLYVGVCVSLQVAYSIRPWWRAFERFYVGRLPDD